MASLNEHTAWAGNIDNVIALSIHERGKSLVDLTRDDGEAGPSGTVKEEPTDERIDPARTSTSTTPASRNAAVASLVLV
jgi:hypothetical protein